MKHLSIDVQGKVQGVFFRASARETAKRLDIKGFVENRPDGSVHIEAEGSSQDLEEFIKWCHEGPPSAMVSAVDYKVKAIEGFQDFSIRR